MPRISVPKESLEGPKRITLGIYDVRLDGFAPQWSDAGDSINLFPDLRIINNAEYHNRRIREVLNQKGGWALLDFCHGFGQEMIPDPDNENEVLSPIIFDGEDGSDPKTWRYNGVMLGQIAHVELGEAWGRDNKGPYTNIKRYFCRVPGCTARHSEDLLKRN